jgi:hypothetical protein
MASRPLNCCRNRASRQGATIWISGMSAYAVTSNRTWSLPLPVAPWLMVPALLARAISTIRFAISGRAMDVPSR